MKEQEFVVRVREVGRLADPAEARRWSLVALRALADLFPDAETRRHFLSQLPGGLKATLRGEPPRGLLMDPHALAQHVGAALDLHAAAGERVLRTVYAVLKEALGPGQLADFQRRVPADVAHFLDRER